MGSISPMIFGRRKHNPVFYADQLAAWVGEGSARHERILTDPDSVDLLVWNVFMSLDTHRDPDYLAYRLQALAGADLRAPFRISPWTGRDREPLLRPSAAYVEAVRERARSEGGGPDATAALEAPIEAAVRIESPDVLCFVEPMMGRATTGTTGRDRVLELVEAGLEHARRLSKQLAIGTVYEGGTEAAQDTSTRLMQLRDGERLAEELPHRSRVPEVGFQEVTWDQLLLIWDQEVGYLDLAGEPVGAFRAHLDRRGLTSPPVPAPMR